MSNKAYSPQSCTSYEHLAHHNNIMLLGGRQNLLICLKQILSVIKACVLFSD